MSIPTLLTWARIGLIPVFMVCFYLPFQWTNEAAAIVFLLAAITDWLDGYLARKWDETSRFGAFLDPVADKLMVAAALVMLVQKYPSLVLVLPAVVIIGREITVSALREWMAEIGERASVAVSTMGKVKTMVQMFSLTLLIYGDPLFGFPTFEIGVVLLYLAVVLTMWSMLVYTKAAWPALKDE